VGALRLGFAGTPAFAADILLRMLQANRRPAVVYTQPDRSVGRGRTVHPGPVKVLALEHGIEVAQPESLKVAGAPETLVSYELDLLVVAAYGLLLPPAILEIPTLGCINVHASLLPRWRGAAPVERAIMAGDAVTGISIMRMDTGLDTGPVYLARECPIDRHETGPGLEIRLAALGSQALLDCLDQLPDIEPVAQSDEGACYAMKLTQMDAQVDWTRSAIEIERQVRALCGRMPAFCYARSTRLQILEATARPGFENNARPGTIVDASGSAGISIACGAGTLSVTCLRLDRGKGQPLTAAQALSGFPGLLGLNCVLHVQPS